MYVQPQNYNNCVFKTCALGTSQEFSWEMVSQREEKDSVVKEVWESFLMPLLKIPEDTCNVISMIFQESREINKKLSCPFPKLI